MRHMQPRRLLVIIIALAVITAIIDLPTEQRISIHQGPVNIETTIRRPPFDFTFLGKRFTKDLSIRKGLDLQGGTHIVLKADMENIAAEDRSDALDSATAIISRRVDLFGVSEPVVQSSIVNDDYRIIVELPGLQDINQALNLIGQTAQLDFRELPEGATESATFADFVATGLTGEHLKRSTVQFGSQTGAPEVGIEFDSEGSDMFAEITKRNVGKPVAIFLDNFPVTVPNVQQEITGGQAVISGQFDLEQAKQLSIQLNAGALPVPIEVIEQENIGASLGEDSVQKSMRAGIAGLSVVMLFMILYYGWLGFIADVALMIYALFTLALYKLIPVTLTLPGLAGFILSVGMAVDSNILIFERMKEELRMGKPWKTAMELGFGRAWDSIKDANVATLMTAFVLFNPLDWPFLVTSGMVRGFALTLSLGVLISLFTGIIVSRTLIRIFYKERKHA